MLCFIFKNETYAQTQQDVPNFKWKAVVLSKDNNEKIPFAAVTVFSNKRTIVFIADENGAVELFYIYPTKIDSLTVSAIGFNSKNYNINNLPKGKIALETKFISLNEVSVLAPKYKKVVLGNKSAFVKDDTNGNFGGQKVLLIKNKDIKGRILAIRYRMVENKKDFFRPFRVRIYAKDTLNQTVGADLLNTNLIISQNKGKWVKVDVSSYNIELPANGVFVGYEILSKEYYFSRNIIKDDKVGAINALNNVFIKVSKHTPKTKLAYETWEYISSSQGWIPSFCKDIDPIINIVVEAESR
jgi:hypothetical protein